MLTSMIHGPSYLLLWQMNVVESIPLLLPRVEQGAFPPLLDLGLTKWMLGVGHIGCLDKRDVSECDIVRGLRCACAVSLHFCTSATTMRRAYWVAWAIECDKSRHTPANAWTRNFNHSCSTQPLDVWMRSKCLLFYMVGCYLTVGGETSSTLSLLRVFNMNRCTETDF